MRRIRLILEYDGTAYHGWQRQKNANSIQQLMEDTLLRIIGEEVTVSAAGRTDAGVHALGQVAAFDTDSNLEGNIIKRALNAMLPVDVRVLALEDAGRDFNPRYDAISKKYFYLITDRNQSSVFLHRYIWETGFKLNIDDIRKASEFLVGRHDFSSFRASGCGAKNAERELYSVDIEELSSIGFMSIELKGHFIRLSLSANAFLRHMVRNIVGTLVEVGRGKMKPEDIAGILESKDRRLAGPTAPAKGLFLEKVVY